MYSRTVRTALIVIYVYIWCFKLWRMSGAGDGLSMSLDVSRYFSQAYSSTKFRLKTNVKTRATQLVEI